MGLKFKVNIAGFIVAACIALTISGLAVWTIDHLSLSLNQRLLTLELEGCREKVAESVLVLEEIGLSGVSEYVSRAKSDLLAGFANRADGIFGRLDIVTLQGNTVLSGKDGNGRKLEISCLERMAARGGGELDCPVNGAVRVGRYVYLPEWDWLMLMSVSAEEMHRTRNQFLHRVGLVFVLVSLLGWWLFVRMARGVVSPVLALSKAASDIRHGDWDSLPEPLDREDEIGGLSRNFAAMANRLRDAQADLITQADFLRKTNVRLEAEIEERIRAERELRKATAAISGILDSMPSLVIGVDADCFVTHWNKSARILTGLGPEIVVGRSLREAMPRLSGLEDTVRRSIAGQEPARLDRSSYTWNGELRQEDILIFPLVGETAYGAVIRLDDVTERVRLEQVMIHSEKMTSLGGLAAGMAHEINSPLAGIGASAFNIRNRIYGDLQKNESAARECGVSLEGIRSYATKREIPKIVDSISEAGERAARIVRNMLKFSRNAESVFAAHDIGQLLDSTLELVASDYELKKACPFGSFSVVREYQESMPGVLCEGSEMQQVFFNLFKNGIQAMASREYLQDSPKLTVRLREDGKFARIEIEDNGPGMSDEVLRRIFEPFFTTKPVGQGTGLGLSVSYFIVTRQHGGTMEVRSLPCRGTTFTILLPLMRNETPTPDQCP